MNVLVVDDEPAVRESLERVLRHLKNKDARPTPSS
jgi:CheY-like chemotaxis protein